MAIPPASLSTGQIYHKRHGAPGHELRFAYWGLMLELQHISTTFARLWPVRLGLASFQSKNHGNRYKTQNLTAFARQKWHEAGVHVPHDARIFLSCFPRQFGYVFNPLSVYWAWHHNQLIAVLFEVRNTVGGIHHYPFGPPQASTQKVFYVSPFIDGVCQYHFTVQADDSSFALKIDVVHQDNMSPVLTATQTAKLSPLTTANLLKHICRRPLQSYAVMAQILWHAARLKLKGVAYHPPSKAQYLHTPHTPYPAYNQSQKNES